jgi:hypothetical protein
MLNKGQRPGFVDEFRVTDVQFGTLPPLLMNMQWLPHMNGSTASNHTAESADAERAAIFAARAAAAAAAAAGGPGLTAEQNVFGPQSTADEHDQYFAGCTADMVFRSGIKFTIETR